MTLLGIGTEVEIARRDSISVVNPRQHTRDGLKIGRIAP